MLQIIFLFFLTTLIAIKCVFLIVNIIYIFCSLCKLDNADEQAAQIRRELDGRLQLAEQMARVSGCFHVPKMYLLTRLSGMINNVGFHFLILTLNVIWQHNSLGDAFLSSVEYVWGRERAKFILKGCILCNPTFPSSASPVMQQRVYYLGGYILELK